MAAWLLPSPNHLTSAAPSLAHRQTLATRLLPARVTLTTMRSITFEESHAKLSRHPLPAGDRPSVPDLTVGLACTQPAA